MSKKIGFWARTTGDLSPMGKVWFWAVLIFVCVCGLYIGLWTSVTFAKHDIDVPYITADSYHDQQVQMAAVFEDMAGEDGNVTILLLGADFREGETMARSDTIMVAFMDLETPSVGLLSIPRDTYVHIDGVGNTKINHAFSNGGEDLTEKTVEQFLGTEIDRYLQVDFEGFAEIVDALGGVDMNVEYDMYLPYEGIDLKKGQQHLDGKSALAYVRWRGTPTADIGRVERQQEFLKATADQMMSLGTITKLPKIFDTLSDHVDTDLSKKEIFSLMKKYMLAGDFDVYSTMVPGEGEYVDGVSYWKPFEGQIPALLEKMRMTPEERAIAYPETVGTPETEGTEGTAEGGTTATP